MVQEIVLKSEGLKKVYPPNFVALDGFDLELHKGEFTALLGPNGCGKTTFLKIVSGIEDYQDGVLEFDGNKLKGTDPRRSVIFQDIRLFPWMTIRDNIRFGLECRGKKKLETNNKAEEWIKKMDLKRYADAFPQEAPPGISQVANVARILSLDPDLILCDEPFNFLDWKTRNFLQNELFRYWYETRKTILFVTHNMEEAVYMAQKVFVMTARPGQVKEIIKVDLPDERTEVRTDDTNFLKAVRRVMELVGEEVSKARKMEGLPEI